MSYKPIVLIIRDGWGQNPHGFFSKQKDGNATLLAKTPFHNDLFATYPMCRLSASGEDVGLPKGQMGNSEVGHMNLGAGRIVYQDLTRINIAIENEELKHIKSLTDTFEKIKNNKKVLHFIGLISDGGVHSHQDHLIALVKQAKINGIDNIKVHAITDGRDTSPTGGEAFLGKIEDELAKLNTKIDTVIGRYYAMDRDNRWDRTKLAWEAIVNGKGEKSDILPSETLKIKYEEGKTDEFIMPIIFSDHDTQRIKDGDGVIFFNFRADRARQLSDAFLSNKFNQFDRGNYPKVNYLTMTEYQKNYKCPIIFEKQKFNNSLGEVVSKNGFKQLRIAETEKYPHVTYFFNVGVESPYDNEDREIIPSPKVATYDLRPEMSAEEVTETTTNSLNKYDLVILNFANPDMVGHTGSVDAAIKAVEKIDMCVQKVVEKTLQLGGKLLITADHGNCEFMKNNDGSPHTAHTTNLVHFLYVGEDHLHIELKDGILADVSPTILFLLGIDKPKEMTGNSLIKRKKI